MKVLFLSVWAAAFKMGIKAAMTERLTMIGRFCVWAVIVEIYHGFFSGIPVTTLEPLGLNSISMTWYIGLTELFLFTSARHFRDFQNEILSEEIALSFLRPCPVWIVKHGDWCGQSVGRLVLLVLPCLVFLGLVTGDFSLASLFMGGIVVGFPLGISCYMAFHFMIGSTCLWLKQSDPVFWTFQKSQFLFGALLWPLALYPLWLQKLVWLTPFPVMLAVPGMAVLGVGLGTFLMAMLYQVLATLLVMKAMVSVDHGICRHLQKAEG